MAVLVFLLLDAWTTRTDSIVDSGAVDLGVHYPWTTGIPIRLSRDLDRDAVRIDP